MHNKFRLGLLAALALLRAVSADAAEIIGGSVTMTLDEGKGSSIGFFNAYFDGAATRAQSLSLPAPGNAPFTRLSGTPGTLGTSTTPGIPGIPGTVQVVDPIRPFGVPVTPGSPGTTRSPQATTLDVDPNNVLGSWSASNDAYAFVGNSTLGEQIAFTDMQRWGGPFTGALLYGDFALRYVPSRDVGANSGLVLTSNIDFLNAVFAQIANESVSVANHQLFISGDLVAGEGLFVLDPTTLPGTRIGTFSMVANLDGYAVPEPSSMVALLIVGCVALAAQQLVRSRKVGAQGTSR